MIPPTLTLDRARRWFSEGLWVMAHVEHEHVLDAFAALPRERFAGPGARRFFNLFEGYWSTPDADIRWPYHNVLITLDGDGWCRSKQTLH